MAELYPPIEPFEHGMLAVGDGHSIYWEVCGNPDGLPAVVLHGGPGSGCTPWHRRLFDPSIYRIVLFDQRNCGRSLPHASDPSVDLETNTTAQLLGDIEALREQLGIERWLVLGGSWGSVLGLAYAEAHPERVSALVLWGVATGTDAEVRLLTRGIGPLFPEAWARFRDGVPASERDGDLARAYARLLEDADPAVRERAARDWCAWEDASVPGAASNPRYEDPAFRMAFARIVTHYWSRGHFLEEGQVLRAASRLAGVPGVIVQGRLDLGNLVGTPWLLHEAWPGSELVMVDEAGHSGSASGIASALVEATDRFGRGG
ncbi:MAG: prolyl aminopeptidase [Dehalococcoidia bacterium]